MKLKIGDKAPDFKSKDQEGKEIKLSDYKGKKLLLYFYPKDNTPGCTAEACDLRDNFEEFTKQGIEIIGVSPDSEKSHQNFIQKHNLPFRLIADTDKKILEDYGVWAEKKMYGRTYMGVLRTSFLIDENGMIQEIFDKVKTKEHSSQIFKELEVK
jgi:thioredoxin-dependent peroxiredoxin